VDVKFQPLSTETKEGSYQTTRKNNQQAIMVSHGVSPAIIGIADAANLGSGKGTAQQENYKDRVVSPSQARWQRALNKLFRLGLGVQYVGIEFNEFDITDDTKQRENSVAFLVLGCTTINEVREKCRIGPPLPGGNRAFILTPSGLIMFIDELEKYTDEEALKRDEDKLKQDAEKRLTEAGISPDTVKSMFKRLETQCTTK